MAKYKVYSGKIIPGDLIFDLHETHGFPFEMSAMAACQKRMIIGWEEFIECAIKAGWQTNNLVQRIKHACKEAGYNDEIMAEIGQRVG